MNFIARYLGNRSVEPPVPRRKPFWADSFLCVSVWIGILKYYCEENWSESENTLGQAM